MCQIVVTGDYVEGSFDLLELAGDRANAALFLARIAGMRACEKDIIQARWYLRAALCEFRSIFDVLPADLKLLGRAHEWKRSVERAEIESDALVSVLCKVRDFAIHSAVIRGIPKDFKIISTAELCDISSEIMTGIVIEQLDRAALRVERGKDEIGGISDDTLSLFNKQASQWPADLLIHIAIFRVSDVLCKFMALDRVRDLKMVRGAYLTPEIR